MRRVNIKAIDFIPSISGILGKIALVSSFAFVWAEALNISNNSFVFNNIRLELIIVSLFTLIMLFVYPKASPAGSLAPLIVIIPIMASFGVHPLVLSLLVGILGIISIKTGIFRRLLNLSGALSKAGISIVFGISGVILSLKHLYNYFEYNLTPFLLIIVLLSLITTYLIIVKRLWLMIPISIIVSLTVLFIFSPVLENLNSHEPFRLSPDYWWNGVWQMGYGINLINILKALPFAVFVIILWTIDTASIIAVHDSVAQCNVDIDIEPSFISVALRNILGGVMGGAQTGSLWRSFLIPQFMVNRPMKNSVIIMCIMGLIIGATPILLRILTLPPLIWSVLIFGIFIPLIYAGITNLRKINNHKSAILCLIAIIPGLIFNSLITYFTLVVYEQYQIKKEKKIIGSYK